MFSFAEFHNIVKIPVLFEHYKEHQSLDAEISFWSFIRLHYFDALQVDDDYQRDRQLPFRDMDCGMIVNTTICTFSPVALEILPPAEPVREFYHFNDGHTPQFTSFDIFQPPRC